jgi:hypothetical protein
MCRCSELRHSVSFTRDISIPFATNLEPAVDSELEQSANPSAEQVDCDSEIDERRKRFRRWLFWWLLTRSSLLLSLMTVARFALFVRVRVKKIRLENPYAF